MDKEEFKSYLDKQTYDKYYQDIEHIGFKGYSESSKTWENIKNLIDWNNKSIIDLGCFHGYFCFKAEQAGATVVWGLEGHPTYGNQILETVNLIKEMNGSKVNFICWDVNADEVGPECDIALCLNCLHHFPDQEKVLSGLKCKWIICEINNDQIELVKKYFTIIKRILSHRKNRVILLGEAPKKIDFSKMLPYTEKKIFVTGVYGSGKTTYAKSYAKQFNLTYIPFDTYFSYSKGDSDKDFIGMLSDNYITDAIPFNIKTKEYELFNQYSRENEIKVVCCICPDKEEWSRRLRGRKNLEILGRYNPFFSLHNFYKKTLLKFSSANMVYYDTYANEYITKEDMYSKIALI